MAGMKIRRMRIFELISSGPVNDLTERCVGHTQEDGLICPKEKKHVFLSSGLKE